MHPLTLICSWVTTTSTLNDLTHQLFYLLLTLQVSMWAESRLGMGFSGGSVVKNLPANKETQEIWVQSLGQEDPLEKEMTTQSSNLTCEIPWTKEPGGLQPMGWQRVRHNWVTKQQQQETGRSAEALAWGQWYSSSQLVVDRTERSRLASLAYPVIVG